MTTPNDSFGRRSSQPGKPDIGTCACGCDWFELTRGTSAPNTLPHGGVNIDANGKITRHTGDLVCARCKTTWRPPRERLRRVE